MHIDWNFLKKINVLLFVRKWIKWYLIMKPVGEGWWRDCGRPGPAPALATCRHLLVVTWPGEWQAVFPRHQWPGSPVASIKTNGGGRNQSWHVSTGKRQQRGVCDQPRPASTAATVQLTSMVCQTNSADIIQTVPVSGATHIYQLFSGTRYKILMKYFSSKILFQGALSAWLQSMSSAANTIGGNPARPEYSLDQ